MTTHEMAMHEIKIWNENKQNIQWMKNEWSVNALWKMSTNTWKEEMTEMYPEMHKSTYSAQSLSLNNDNCKAKLTTNNYLMKK